MLYNGASAYKDENTAIETMIKEIKPTFFLNVYQSLHKLSELNDLEIKSLADTIIYDSESTFNFNTILPIKTISLNADEVTKEMNENVLKFDTVALSLGIKKENLKQKLLSFIKKVFTPPSRLIRKIALHAGNDPKEVDQYLTTISEFSQKVIIGKIVDLNTKIDHKLNKRKLSTPAIVGIVISVFVVVSVIVAFTLYFVNKKKKEQDIISLQAMLVDN